MDLGVAILAEAGLDPADAEAMQARFRELQEKRARKAKSAPEGEGEEGEGAREVDEAEEDPASTVQVPPVLWEIAKEE
eukprot:10963630-Alexandrium_andersonii.AAC.1